MQHQGWLLEVQGKKKDDDWVHASPSLLGTFLDCHRCGYRQGHGMAFPRVKFPGLPNGIDRCLKQLADMYRRGSSLPPLWGRQLPGRRLYKEPPRPMVWRCEEKKIRFRGIPDEWVTERDGTVSPLDYKTRGSEKFMIYQSYRYQLDSYALLAQKDPTFPKISGKGYLLSFSPILTADGQIPMSPDMVELPVRPAMAREFLFRTAKILRGPRPDSDPECEICQWLTEIG